MGAAIPKQLLKIGKRAILAHTISRFTHCDGIFLVVHPDTVAATEAIAAEFPAVPVTVCVGGATRTDSVRNGLLRMQEAAVAEDALVAIHDGVRPFVSAEMLARGFALAEAEGNAVAAVPVKSSMRRKTENGSEAVDRASYFHVQTPQIFPMSVLADCYGEEIEDAFTDDASLVQSFGHAIHLFEGSYDNIKITTAEDLVVAEVLVKRYS